MAAFRSNLLRWVLLFAVLAALLAFASPLLLRAAAGYLIRADEPWKAEILVVLAGDQHGNRILKACDLIRQGYAPKALVSGPECCYHNFESDLAIAFAVKAGCPAEYFVSFPNKARNTKDEAAAIVSELRRRGIGRFLVVTSDYHTRRTTRAYGAIADPASFRVVAAPDRDFHRDHWWSDREARKVVFFEWSKTVASWIGL